MPSSIAISFAALAKAIAVASDEELRVVDEILRSSVKILPFTDALRREEEGRVEEEDDREDDCDGLFVEKKTQGPMVVSAKHSAKVFPSGDGDQIKYQTAAPSLLLLDENETDGPIHHYPRSQALAGTEREALVNIANLLQRKTSIIPVPDKDTECSVWAALNFECSVVEWLTETVRIMRYTLSSSFLLSSVAVGFILGVEYYAHASLRDDDSGTVVRNREIVIFLCGTWAAASSAWVIIAAALAEKAMAPSMADTQSAHTLRATVAEIVTCVRRGVFSSNLMLAVHVSLQLIWIVPLMYFEISGRDTLDRFAVCGTVTVAVGMATFFMGTHTVKAARSNATLQAMVAARNAVKAIDQGRRATEAMRMGVSRMRRPLWQSALTTMLPTLMILGAGITYIFVVFAVFRSIDDRNSVLKAAVSLVSLVLKVAGNKAQIHFLTHMKNVDKTLAEGLVFGYELLTAMLCRVMIFSIPDERVALVLAVLNTCSEQCTRVAFYLLFLVRGLSQRDAWNKARFTQYLRRGFMRVMDNNNDMVVEYLSSFTAAAILWKLPQSNLFTFAASAESSASIEMLLTLTVIQTAPELFVDFFTTWVEMKGGLIAFHRAYLRDRTLECLLMKLFSTLLCIGIVLMACLET